MPTGYTAMIEEDGITDARAYIERCSRAFGIAIHQRDEDIDKPLEYPKKDSYSHDGLQRAVDRLAKIKSRTPEDIAFLHAEYTANSVRSNIKSQKRHDKKQADYQAVLDKLALWNPEDEISQNIKKFAIDQINLCYKPDEKPWVSSIEHDSAKWQADELNDAQREVDYYTDRVEKDDARYLEKIKSIDIVRKEFLKVPR